MERTERTGKGLEEDYYWKKIIYRLFDKLVWTVGMDSYNVEIWGWEGMERIEGKYLRWILRVDMRTPGYMVREELQREKLRVKAGMRAWGCGREKGE